MHIYNNNCTKSMKHWRKNEEVCGIYEQEKTTILIIIKGNVKLWKWPVPQKTAKGERK